MTHEYLEVAKLQTITQSDRLTNQALIRSANQITLEGDITRWAMHEVDCNFLTARRLAAEALTVVDTLRTRTPQTGRSQDHLDALTHDFLQALVELQSKGNRAIINCAHVPHEKVHPYR